MNEPDPAANYFIEQRCLEANELAAKVFTKVCRFDFTQPGFSIIDLGTKCTSKQMRKLMFSLKHELNLLYQAKTNNKLMYASLCRFDQQITTKFHLDAGPASSLLMLGYEATDIDSRLLVADYSRCAYDMGITPEHFLENYNPMLNETELLLEKYTTELACFNAAHFQIVLFNNSSTPYSFNASNFLGVLHKAEICNPDSHKQRVINSTMLVSTLASDKEIISVSEQQDSIARE